MTDHVPFYTTLSGEGLDFHNAFFGIVLSENADTCFNGCLRDFNGLGFGDDNQSDFIRIAVTLLCGISHLVERIFVVFTDGGNKFKHEVIIIFPICAPLSAKNIRYCREINAPKRPVRPFSARCENQSSVWQAVQIPQTSIWPTPARSSCKRLGSHKLKWIFPLCDLSSNSDSSTNFCITGN